MIPEDRIGEQYGVLKIIGIDMTNKGRVYWCRCEVCGEESNYSLGELKEVHKCNHVSRYGKYINWNMVWKKQKTWRYFQRDETKVLFKKRQRIQVLWRKRYRYLL